MKHRKNTATLLAGVHYPAKTGIYPFVAGQLTELLTLRARRLSLSLKARISNMSNPFYGVPGLRAVMAGRKLKDHADCRSLSRLTPL